MSDPTERTCIRRIAHPAHKWMLGRRLFQCPGVTADSAPNNERRWRCYVTDDEVPCAPDSEHTHTFWGCGYVDAAPVPSSVPSRPDTAKMRAEADDLDHIATTTDDYPRELQRAAIAFRSTADWIDAQPAADQGPDLEELRAARERTLATVDRHAYAALYAAVDRLLDREGGTQ